MKVHKESIASEGWPEKLRVYMYLHTNASHSPCELEAALFDLCTPVFGILNSEL